MSFWILFLAALGSCALLMASVWVLAYSVNNAGIVDVAWAFAFAFVAGLGLLLYPDKLHQPSVLLAAMFLIWSLRLGSYLLRRVSAAHPEEDGRYQILRQQFPDRTWLVFFGFFQAQGLLVVLLSVPLILVLTAGPRTLQPLHYAALCIWLLALFGEGIADRQLERFRANPDNRGHTCREGLWRYSRHPNYFFEWLVWVAFFVYALPSPLGWLTIYCPLLMLFFLFRVTGIPATEAQALKSRPDYADYQRTTSAFVPLPPRRLPPATAQS